MSTVITILFLLQLKHFICDFPLQKAYQYLNKGKYGHPGGIIHAQIHAIFTFGVLVWFTPLAINLAMMDFFLHYHIDWAKVQINTKYGWKCDNSEKFWILLGLDQFLHQLTYLLLVYYTL